MSEALEDLQVKVAFLEDALAKLGEEFYLQQKELQKLKAQHNSLLDKVGRLDGDSNAGDILDEAPPHY